MRNLQRAILALITGLSLPIAGCAEQTSPATGSGGTGGTTAQGGGGAGGADCVEEVCDGTDNDCDGEVDEGCECKPGDTEACYTGPPATQGIGTCKDGARTCDPATYKFGPCMDEVLPAAAETCDGLDENCNGTVDEGLPDIVCGIGACAASAPGCVDGKPGVCTPGVPSMEICDLVDNDCDQLVDEAFPEDGEPCDTGALGICQPGTTVCQLGALSCFPMSTPGGEACDGLDNDCDGTVDNNIPGTGGDCGTGQLGVCATGKISCQNMVVDCFPVTPSSPEICDNLDNDCDGQTDEMNPEGGGSCDTGLLGACQLGTVNCVSGNLVCQPNALAQTEVCDGKDNNCDGQTDEGNPGAGQACSCGGTSVCQGGLLFCQGCTKEVDCNNNLDDDGDNQVDCNDSQCALGCDVNVAPCPAGQKLLVLSSTDTPKNINDNGSVSSVIPFTETGIVKRVVLRINITHTFDGDLDITLKGPGAASVDVTSDNGGTGENYSNTIFNDACATNITAGTPPYAGCFKPEVPLSTLNEQPINGNWTLTVADDAGSDTGTFNSWTLAMCIQ